MRTLPITMIRVLAPFAPLFSERVFEHAQVLIAGAILTPGKRTVSSALRAMALDQSKTFHRYHRVLSRAKWSSMQASRILLDSLVEAFVPEGDPLVVGIDETLERRQEKKISTKGIYRDPVRSSHTHLVKNQRTKMDLRGALGGGTVGFEGVGSAFPLGASVLRALRSRAGQTPQESHRVGLADALAGKTLVPRTPDRGRRRRWICFLEAPGSLPASQEAIAFITRLRLDTALYESASPRKPGQMGRPRIRGSRLPNLSRLVEDPKTAWMPISVSDWYGAARRTVEIVSNTAIWYSTGLPAVPVRWVLIRDPQEEFETQALLCTDLDADPERIISWFVKRWQMEATFQEARQRLGFETQRHWSKRAIQRTAPALLGLFSVLTLLAHQYMAKGEGSVRRTAWYDKTRPTFSDALALVRRKLWSQEATCICGSVWEEETLKVPRKFIERLTDTVCYAA